MKRRNDDLVCPVAFLDLGASVSITFYIWIPETPLGRKRDTQREGAWGGGEEIKERVKERGEEWERRDTLKWRDICLQYFQHISTSSKDEALSNL